MRYLLPAAAILGGLGVALGAFGAHWLEDAVTRWELDGDQQRQRLETWQVAVRYQMFHVLALLVVGLLDARRPSRSLSAAAALMTIGILIFSGCLYAYVLSGVRWLGAVVPLGGVCLIAGWAAVAIGTRPGRA